MALIQTMDQLHELGWTDSDILEALSHGTNMIASSILTVSYTHLTLPTTPYV